MITREQLQQIVSKLDSIAQHYTVEGIEQVQKESEDRS